MRLMLSSTSPYARKVRAVAIEKGLQDAIELIEVNPFGEATAALRAANPLGKVPALLLDDGRTIFDSPVICEYLDLLKAEPRIIPADPMERIRVLTLASLADGLIEAALTIVMEWRFRPQEKWVQSWLDRQQAKIDASLVWFEENLKPIGATPNYGEITTACALGYLDFRHKGAWRAKHPKLAQWLADFDAKVPAFGETMPKD